MPDSSTPTANQSTSAHSRAAESSGRKTRLRTLDGLRGAAALVVMLGHIVWLLWASDASVPVWNLVEKLVAFFVRYGAQAVVLFFMLSGFGIHLREARQFARNEDVAFRAGAYAWRRIRRLYPPMLLAIALTILLDRLGARFNPAAYAGQIDTEFSVVFQNVSHDAKTIVGNLLFLQNVAPGIRSIGTNGPLWAMSYQMVYYLLYPLIYLPLRRRTNAEVTALILIAASLIAAPLAGSGGIIRVLAYFGTWVMGAWLAELAARQVRLPRPALWLIAAGAGIAVLMLGYSWPLYEVLRDWLWVLCFAVLILLAAAETSVTNPLLRAYRGIMGIFAHFAPFSYTLYVIHMPIVAFVAALWLAQFGSMPGTGWLALIVSAGVIALSWLAAKLVEQPFSS